MLRTRGETCATQVRSIFFKISIYKNLLENRGNLRKKKKRWAQGGWGERRFSQPSKTKSLLKLQYAMKSQSDPSIGKGKERLEKTFVGGDRPQSIVFKTSMVVKVACWEKKRVSTKTEKRGKKKRCKGGGQ